MVSERVSLQLVVLRVEGRDVGVLLERPVHELALFVGQSPEVGEDLLQGVPLLSAQLELALLVGLLDQFRGLQTGLPCLLDSWISSAAFRPAAFARR